MNINRYPLPEVRASRVMLRRDLCPIVACPCGAHVQLTYHDPRGNGRMLHDICPSCGSDVYLDVRHYLDMYVTAVRKYVGVGREDIAGGLARRAVTFYRKNRAAIISCPSA